ncbi:helix-turn-helix domain-containing protein [Massiliimalia timonensis]|uniref:helix-turn-helix domain-containing protein n=1 Tax=Massiliimalia timonensis TaxID=1987501 RepID=UPI00189DBC22|nr:helix-turn-helix transcriptional regulator [Massiliimalia timonensis]
MRGEILAELRKDKGLTQKEVAEIIGVSPATISNYEIGIIYPSVENLIKLAELFDVNCDFLLERTRYRFSWDYITQGIQIDDQIITFDKIFSLFSSLNNKNRIIAMNLIESLLISQKTIKKKK